MAKIQTMRFDGRRFGWKAGNSQIGVKEYFDKAETLYAKMREVEEEKRAYQDADDDTYKRLTAKRHGYVLRLRAVESRSWTPMESFIIDRPLEDGVNLETFVKGQILARIEVSNEMETDQTGQSNEPQTVRAESKTVGL